GARHRPGGLRAEPVRPGLARAAGRRCGARRGSVRTARRAAGGIRTALAILDPRRTRSLRLPPPRQGRRPGVDPSGPAAAAHVRMTRVTDMNIIDELEWRGLIAQ